MSTSPEAPRITVVIPAYNAADFIAETVESVLAQTVPVEIIVVDDGSKDETAAVVEGLGSGVRLIRQPNGGVSSARNHGLREASGEYICFFDADDWMAPTNLERKIHFLDENPDFVLAHALVEVTDEALNPTGEIMSGVHGESGAALVRLIPPAIPLPSNVVTRRAAVEALGGFDEELSTSADFDMWLRLSAEGKAGRIDEPLVLYRRHPGAMFTNLELQLHDMGIVLRKYRGGSDALAKLDWRGLARRFHLTVLKARIRRGQWVAAIPQALRFLRAVVLG